VATHDRRASQAGAGHSDETALVRRAQGGDAEAFACLVETHRAALARFCGRLVGDSGTAEDLAQETLLRAQQALPRLEAPERFGAWLFGIAANLARKAWRRNARAPLSLERLASGMPPPAWYREPLAAEAVTPEPAFEAADRARRLFDAVGHLPPALRHPVVLHYLEGLSYAEIAAALAVPATTVRGRLALSRSRLRRAFDPDGARRGARPWRRQQEDTRMMADDRQPGDRGPEVGLPAGAAGALERAIAGAWWEAIRPGVAYTAEARDVFVTATRELWRWNHQHVGTEHLLAGLVHDEGGTPARALATAGATPDRVREMLAARLARREGPPTAALKGATARTRIAIELGIEEARHRAEHEEGPAYLLLGVVQVRPGIAALLLESLGVDLERVRTAALAAIGG
jgi:RNA polymerase sigma-70 factor (ECF subfamily)